MIFIPQSFYKIMLLVFCLGFLQEISFSQNNKSNSNTALYKPFIEHHFPERLTSPEKKKRKSFAQFGYGLSFFAFPLFPITEFIPPDDFGKHSYCEPDNKEKNGSLYTCKGGLMDFSH